MTAQEFVVFFKWWFEIEVLFLYINKISMEIFSWHCGIKEKKIPKPSGLPISFDQKQLEDKLDQ